MLVPLTFEEREGPVDGSWRFWFSMPQMIMTYVFFLGLFINYRQTKTSVMMWSEEKLKNDVYFSSLHNNQ